MPLSILNHSTRFSLTLFALLLACCSVAQEDSTGQPVVIDPVVEELTTTEGEEEEEVNKKQPLFVERTDTLAVSERALPPDELRRLKDDKDFWYADLVVKRDANGKLVLPEEEKGKKTQKGNHEKAIREEDLREPYVPLGQRSWFQTFLWILMIGVFVAAIVFYLGSSQVGLFRRKSKTVGHNPEGADEWEDIFSIPYQAEIDKAVARGNFRLAVRLHFLQLLRQLSDKQVIRYTQDRTNFDYLSELHSTPYYPPFFRLTRHYEYSWYGQFPVSAEAYAQIRSEFESFHQKLPGA